MCNSIVRVVNGFILCDRAVVVGCQSLQLGETTVSVCGGQECMSQAPHCVHLRSGVKMGSTNLVDTMIHDGLTDAFHNIHMGETG